MLGQLGQRQSAADGDFGEPIGKPTFSASFWVMPGSTRSCRSSRRLSQREKKSALSLSPSITTSSKLSGVKFGYFFNAFEIVGS